MTCIASTSAEYSVLYDCHHLMGCHGATGQSRVTLALPYALHVTFRALGRKKAGDVDMGTVLESRGDQREGDLYFKIPKRGFVGC